MEAAGHELLVVGEDSSLEECASCPGARKASVLHPRHPSFTLIIASQSCCFGLLPLLSLEAALLIGQVQAAATVPRSMWLVTTGALTGMTRKHLGVWGLARSTRAEALAPLMCVDVSGLTMCLQFCPSIAEPEEALHTSWQSVPRLASASLPVHGLVRLHLHERGAVSNLHVEREGPLRADAGRLLLRVCAVGLNFRDVLNVLGEYPGDPGPPGADTAGMVVVDSNLSQETDRAAFGMGYAPLASVASSLLANLFVNQATALTFEQACTLPVTWSTTHAAVERAELRSGCAIAVHAVMGGVGLKAVEYAGWLLAPVMGSAGQPHKHARLRTGCAVTSCSSRVAGAFAAGVVREVGSARLHAVLSSLSYDFVSVSFAVLGEGGAFQEIGKRSVWSLARHRECFPLTSYCTIALDADMSHNLVWMHSVLCLLADRSSSGAVASLQLVAFDMERQYELAFRTLQGGLNTGKVVVRITVRRVSSGKGQLVTGGSGGLGLLTGRWLSEHGARRLVLASRKGLLAIGGVTEWEELRSGSTAASLEQSDAGEDAHARQLALVMPSLVGVWHAAGVLTDAVLSRQDALVLAQVYAPKAYGAWGLHAACSATALSSFALFSSVAALLGGAGQANYSAANACLDSLASCRRARFTCGSSVQWSAWAEVGMAARGAASERVAAMEAVSGFGRIGLALGLCMLCHTMWSHTPGVMGAVPAVWSRFLAYAAATSAFLSAFATRQERQKAAPVSEAPAARGRVVSLDTVVEMVQRTAGELANADAPLMEAGVDSLGAVELRNQLQSAVGAAVSLPSTVVFDHPTARQLASMLQPAQTASAATAPALVSRSGWRCGAGSVATEGTSALLPASSPVRCIVACGHDAATEVPTDRWVGPTLPLPEPMASRVRHGGFVLNAELVDNAAFGISPAEATAMDPIQRLLLEREYAALHCAGEDRTALGGSLTGVFVGFAGTEFAQVLAASPVASSVYAATGSTSSIASGRLSYVLGLHGPCISYDTACSAALVACHQGLRALELGECATTLAAGAALMLAPGVACSFAVAGMTSVRGRSHTFDVRADGYVRGEACGAVVVRCAMGNGSLCLLGSAVRQDGRSASLTAPNGQAQQSLLSAALTSACTAAGQISLHEAHGTGTALGDPIEAGSLREAMLVRRKEPLAVGGVKANVGHAEPAAGMAGLLKLAVAHHGGTASPNAQLHALNPHLSSFLQGGGGVLPTQMAYGAHLGLSAGGVSSFGYSGTIAHALLQYEPSTSSTRSQLIPLHYRRQSLSWVKVPHLFAMLRQPSADCNTSIYHTYNQGILHVLIAHHVVQGRVLFPATGYLEMARAAMQLKAALSNVFFLHPFTVGGGLLIQCTVKNDRFEVRSCENDQLREGAVHCSGAFTAFIEISRMRRLSTFSEAHRLPAHVSLLYDSFDAVGLQYGPGYRTLSQGWAGDYSAAARLQVRASWLGTQVHPADLDDALCVGAVASTGSEKETHLPFAVDTAVLHGASVVKLWAVRSVIHHCSPENVPTTATVHL